MDGRKRTVQLKFRVTEAERDLILEKNEVNTYPQHGGVSAENRNRRIYHSDRPYQAEKTGTSWKGKLKVAVDALIPQASDFADFLRLLQAAG